jgi:hypothetical protein
LPHKHSAGAGKSGQCSRASLARQSLGKLSVISCFGRYEGGAPLT